MKNYTVKEISELLKINPETVRRWIRNGQLEAVQVSRKDGNVISEESLKSFIKKSPQYAPLVAGLFVTSPMSLALTIGAICTTVLSTAFLKKKEAVSADYVKDTVKKEITRYERSAAKKQEAIAKLQQELAEDQKHIEEYRYALAHCNFDEIAQDITHKL